MAAIRTLTAVTAIVVITASMTPTRAYSTYGKWGSMNVAFYVNPANADLSQNAAISGVQGAMAIWNTQAGTPFRFSYGGQVSDTTLSNDRKNVVLFRNQSNGSAIASTYSWTSGGILVDSDVVFWDGAFKFFTGSGGCVAGAYIEDVGAHEMGHALGLSHSTVTGATMTPGYSGCSMTQRTLESDDIAAARSLYGTSGSTTDTSPTATIAAPTSGTTVPSGTPVTFSGSASDTPDGNVSSYLVWRSNIEGQIGLGASFSKALTVGSHTITATVTDSTGHTASASTLVNVTSSNTAPVVTIASPASGATVTAGTSMTFSGSATDTQDGSLTGALVWQSNIDGQLGTGGSFTRALTAGTHTITAKVTDSGGAIGQKSITVTASSPTTLTGPKLSARGYKEKGLQKTALTWSGLTATNVDVYRGNAKVQTTANTGSTIDHIDKKGNGAYTYKVCAAGTSTCSNLESVTF